MLNARVATLAQERDEAKREVACLKEERLQANSGGGVVQATAQQGAESEGQPIQPLEKPNSAVAAVHVSSDKMIECDVEPTSTTSTVVSIPRLSVPLEEFRRPPVGPPPKPSTEGQFIRRSWTSAALCRPVKSG